MEITVFGSAENGIDQGGSGKNVGQIEIAVGSGPGRAGQGRMNAAYSLPAEGHRAYSISVDQSYCARRMEV